jgi:hypothetical protein
MSGLEPASAPGSDDVARHVSGCPPCAAFELQLALVTEAVRQACSDYEAEIPADFELRLIERLRA